MSGERERAQLLLAEYQFLSDGKSHDICGVARDVLALVERVDAAEHRAKFYEGRSKAEHKVRHRHEDVISELRERLAACQEFLQFLVDLDDPRAETLRRTVTLTEIINRAAALRDSPKEPG
jgi:hypothetical protein